MFLSNKSAERELQLARNLVWKICNLRSLHRKWAGTFVISILRSRLNDVYVVAVCVWGGRELKSLKAEGKNDL
jgi:hypothetical protein